VDRPRAGVRRDARRCRKPAFAETAARIADEIEPGGPYLDGVDGLVAAVGREWGAPVVSADSDLTHEETKRVVAVEEYR
jgi:hypothetical protein